MAAPSIAAFLATSGPAIVVEIVAVKGSSPRDSGTFMLVSQTAIWETIGGGQFEYIAIDRARAMLRKGEDHDTLDIPLGPEIGQCCGGRTILSFTRITNELLAGLEVRVNGQKAGQPSVFIFGGGHVGKALASSLSLLPLDVVIVETRKEELHDLPASVTAKLTPIPEAEVRNIPPGGVSIIVTHDHALDFLIAREALDRGDLAYTGMIGSRTKRATFRHWLMREGVAENLLEKLVLPIGGQSVRDKRPAIIAAMVTAEVLTALDAFRARPSIVEPVLQNPMSGA